MPDDYEGEINTDVDGIVSGGQNQEQEPSNYYEAVMKEKKYADTEQLAKAYYHSEKGIKLREGENKQMREYIQKAAPHLESAKKFYEALEDPKKFKESLSEYRKAKGIPEEDDPETTGAVKKEEMDPKVSQFVSDTINKIVSPLKQETAAIKSNYLIKEMREDKTNFKYLNKDVEDEMAVILEASNQGFPTNMSGLKILYEAAIGRKFDSILEDERKKVTEDNYKTFLSKRNSFTESDLLDNGGNKSRSDNQSYVDDILNAKY